jgi:outer membrane protein OmpA-like peptidoglycan-associated protein
MLQRFALLLLLFVVMGVSAMLAAGHFGVTLPWDIAVRRPVEPAPSAASNSREPQATGPEQTARAKDEPRGSKGTDDELVGETADALRGAAPADTPSTGNVALDISRISPDGLSVFAGRAAPDSYVTVKENGQPAGTVKADSNGEWTLSTEHKFAGADPKITFEAAAAPPAAPPPPTVTAETKPTPPATSKATSDAATVAGDVMRKFENLVAEAREQARKEEDQQRKAPDEKTEARPATPSTETVTAAASPPPVTQPAPDAVPVAEPTPETDRHAGAASPTASAPASAPPAASASTTAPASTPPAASPDRETAVATTEPAQPKAGPAAIPVPIMFVYNEATLTPEGRHAADLLLEYLNLKHLYTVELTGHADERGTTVYNFDLSRDRLDTVSRILKEGGYKGELTLTPKGETEPYMGVDRSKYHGEALFQLDRRVELHVH